MHRRTVLLALLALAGGAHGQARAPYPARPEVQAFIEETAAAHGFSRRELERVLGQARYSATVERLMQPPIPFGQRNWIEYRDRYIEPKRLAAAVAFAETHATTLARAERQTGVPAEIIVAIIGVETYYGRITGNFRTLDVLTTLTFDYTRRADFYRGELVELLLLAREQQTDAASYKGSFAGALGMPQFMPGSIRRWAVDFDGDGRIDLTQPADAIGSVASFLAAHGWQAGLPIVFEVEADEAIVDALGRGILARTPWWEALSAGVGGDPPLPLDAPVLVIDLPLLGADGQPDRAYRAGTVNFSALLHYNRSYFYATAVAEFAVAIRARLPRA